MIALVPLVLIGLVVWIVKSARRSSVGAEGDVQSLRRFLQLSLLLAALFTATSGVSRLLSAALPVDEIAGRRTTELALGLSLTLVAVPAGFVLWRVVTRRVRADDAERATSAWALFAAAACTVSLLVAFVNAVQTGMWLVGIETYAPEAIGSAVAWSALWLGQTLLLRRPGLAPTNPLAQLTILAGSAVGLVALAFGAESLIRYGLEQIYGVVAGSFLASGSAADGLRIGAVMLVLAVPVWWWHWLRQAAHASRTGVWHAYVMLVAVLGGLMTMLISGGVVLHAVLQWFFGVPDATRAAAHFVSLPTAVATFVVGGWMWAYHRRVLDHAAERSRSEAERAFGYLVAGIGLVALGWGVTVLIIAALNAIAPELATTDPGQRNTLVGAVTLLLVGGPVWWVFWRRLQSQVATGEDADRASVSRRTYLFVLLGVAGITAGVSLAVILYVLFRDLLEGTLEAAVLHELSTAIALVLTAGVLAAYHWTVHRGDRLVAPEAAVHPRSVLLVSSDGDGLAALLEDSTGAKVRRLRRLDTAPHPVDVEALTAAVLAAPFERVMVTVDSDGAVSVIPYEAV